METNKPPNINDPIINPQQVAGTTDFTPYDYHTQNGLEEPFKNAAQPLKNSFTNHGNEMDEIISKRLPWMVRWGTVLFAFILTMVAGVCWFIIPRPGKRNRKAYRYQYP